MVPIEDNRNWPLNLVDFLNKVSDCLISIVNADSKVLQPLFVDTRGSTGQETFVVLIKTVIWQVVLHCYQIDELPAMTTPELILDVFVGRLVIDIGIISQEMFVFNLIVAIKTVEAIETKFAVDGVAVIEGASERVDGRRMVEIADYGWVISQTADQLGERCRQGRNEDSCRKPVRVIYSILAVPPP